jgi:hypothetical protein
MKNRKCMYCEVPIYESMGYVLPRDVLLILEGNFPSDRQPRELCAKISCNQKWQQEWQEELEIINKTK